MHGQQDKYIEMHGQQDKYIEMHGQQNIKTFLLVCRGEASNPGAWTGSEITFGQTCLSSFPSPHLYLSTLPETGPNLTCHQVTAL